MATKKSGKKSGKKTKDLVPSGGNLPADPTMTFERDAGAGLETADRDSYAIPFLVVLQSNSPQVDEDKDQYVDGAKPGMFYNTATDELFDGKEGVLLVPAHFTRRMVEWVPRDAGGGYKGDYAPEDIDMTKLDRDESGRFVLPNGNYLADTRYHFCVQITDDGPRFVVMSLSSTQIKKSRNWMTKMSMLKMEGKDGAKFTPPTFSHAYRVVTVSEENEKGKWKGVSIDVDHVLGDTEAEIYAAAKEFKKQIQSGTARVEEPTGEDVSGDDF
jgi:hypothetical protein